MQLQRPHLFLIFNGQSIKDLRAPPFTFRGTPAKNYIYLDVTSGRPQNSRCSGLLADNAIGCDKAIHQASPGKIAAKGSELTRRECGRGSSYFFPTARTRNCLFESEFL